METDINNPTLENQDDQVSETADQEPQGPSQARSYECTFCKRGFSNAQALGGHMNIHRKDRAKLKQPSNPNQPSTDLTKHMMSTATSYRPVYLNQQPNRPMWPPWIFQREINDVVVSQDDKDDHVGKIHKLPLFAETPASTEDRELIGSHGGQERAQRSPSLVKGELDLELRLGSTEPNDHDDASTTGTIEFF